MTVAGDEDSESDCGIANENLFTVTTSSSILNQSPVSAGSQTWFANAAGGLQDEDEDYSGGGLIVQAPGTVTIQVTSFTNGGYFGLLICRTTWLLLEQIPMPHLRIR